MSQPQVASFTMNPTNKPAFVSDDEGDSNPSTTNNAVSPSAAAARSSVPVDLGNNDDLALPAKQPSIEPVTTSASCVSGDGKPLSGETSRVASAAAAAAASTTSSSPSAAAAARNGRRSSLGVAASGVSEKKSMMRKPPATVPGAVACSGGDDASLGQKTRAYTTRSATSMDMGDLVSGTATMPSATAASPAATVPGAVSVSAAEAAAYESSASVSKKLSQADGGRVTAGGSGLQQNTGGIGDDRAFPTLNSYVSENYDECDGEQDGNSGKPRTAAAQRQSLGQQELEEEYERTLTGKDAELQAKAKTRAGAGGVIAAPGACSVGPELHGVPSGSLPDREQLRFIKEESTKDLLVSNRSLDLHPDHKNHGGVVNNEDGPIQATLVQDDDGPNEETLRQLEEIKRRERELAERERRLEQKMSARPHGHGHGHSHHPHHGHGGGVIIHATPVVADVVGDFAVEVEERSDVYSYDSSNRSGTTGSRKKKKNGLSRMFSRSSSRSESPPPGNLKEPPPGSVPTSIGGPPQGLPKRSRTPAQGPTALAKFKCHELRIGKTQHSDERFATVVVDNINLDGIRGGGGGADNDLRRQDLSGQVFFNIGRKKEHLYSVKFIQPSVMRDGMTPTAKRAVQKLKSELSLLSRIHHENIVAVEGLSTIFSNEKEGYGATKKYHPTSYFFLMENCVSNGTLKERLASNWNKKRGMSSLMGGSKSSLKATFLERVQAIADLSSAISFLHAKNIMHCDITPDNIGFSFIPDSISNGGSDNSTGLKLFNFGRARTLRPNEGQPFQPYDLSLVTKQPMVGSLPYAAPEVGIKDEYHCGLSVDTYAFAILMWEIMTLKTALDDFHQFVMEDTNEQYQMAITPKLDGNVPPALHDLLGQCWHSNRQFRPRMDVVDTFLQQFEKQNRPMQFGLN